MRVRSRFIFLLAAAPLAFSASFSLEQVMSAPFPSALTAAPKGGAVAWVLNEHGARNVWVADAPTYSGRRLTTKMMMARRSTDSVGPLMAAPSCSFAAAILKIIAARLAFESSPLASVSTWRSPVLLIHGDDDRNVPFHQTVALVQALRKQRVDFQELIFPDEIHGFLTQKRWIQAYRAADFLGKHLQDRRPAAGLE
jgi:acetyl esterase/lipase